MNEILSSTIPIFLITLLGNIIKKKWLTSEECWRGMRILSYFILLPTMLFNRISTANLNISSIMRLVFALIMATCIISCALIIYQKRTNFNKIQFTSIFQGSIRYNSYFFLAISHPLLGDAGLAIVAVISSYMIIFTNILSVMIFAYYIPDSSAAHGTKTTVFLMIKLIGQNPLIIASVIGFIFNFFDLELHLSVKKTLSILSDAALAISMLNVGANLKFSTDKTVFPHILFASFVKLVFFPIVTVIILWLMSVTGTDKSVGILYSCLPCSSTAYVLSRQLGGDPESMTSIITFSTIFSIISLSIFMYILC